MTPFKPLLLIFTLSTLLIAGEAAAEQRMFSKTDVQNLCSTIKGVKHHNIANRMERLIKKAGITKEQWNKHYAFEVTCLGNSPLFYSLGHELEDLRALAEYGVDLNHSILDSDGNISTVKDYIRYKVKTVGSDQRSKYKRMYKIIRDKGAKGCKEQRNLKCTATYIK